MNNPNTQAKANSSKPKSRNFTFLLYPESLPTDWELKIEMLGYPCAISPLHDKDIMKVTEDGEIIYKKPHYHGLMVLPSPVTAQAVRNKLANALGGKGLASMVQIVNKSVDNMYSYLTHESKDAIAKNKHVYDKAEIKHLNEFDISRYIVIDTTDKKIIRESVIANIKKWKLKNILDLVDLVESDNWDLDFGMEVIHDVSGSYMRIFDSYFDAVYRRWKAQEKDEVKKLQAQVDRLTRDLMKAKRQNADLKSELSDLKKTKTNKPF